MCNNHFKQHLGSIGSCDCKCPKRPERDRFQTLTFENCVPFAGEGRETNIIFDVEPNSLPVVLAGTIENFSGATIIVTVERNGGDVSLLIPPKSSLTFIYNGVTRVRITSRGDYTGLFKFQATYTVEVE